MRHSRRFQADFPLIDLSEFPQPPLRAKGRIMDRIKILDDTLWQTVPPDVIKEAEQSARAEPSWIVRQSNGHIVVVEDGPGSPDTATGDISYIAEVAARSA